MLAGDDSATFPAISRFPNTQTPLVIAETTSFSNENFKVWTQIPFAKTLVIPLLNVRKDQMLGMNGFDVSDIPKLIELSKQTGRVQFALRMTPKDYVGLDHLQSIFDELHPPMFQPVPMEAYADHQTWESWHDEFDALAKRSFLPYMFNRIVRKDGESQEFYSAVINNRAFAFGKLKLLKIDDAIAAISDALVNDPDMAGRLLFGYDIIFGQFFDALPANRNMDYAKAQFFKPVNSQSGSSEADGGSYARYPVEVGAFLMKKMTLNPSTYYGCIDVIDRYKQNDLYKVLESMDRAIRNKENDETISSAEQMGTIMDNVWKDVGRIKIADEAAKEGIGLGVAAIGSFATSMLGAGTGIVEGALAGLGFNVADRVLGKFDSSISKKLLRLLNKDYIMNIYDFQKKLPNNS